MKPIQVSLLLLVSLLAQLLSVATQATDPQTSLTLDPSVVVAAFANGQGQGDGEANSLQSTNNFINFCYGKTVMNGTQNRNGTCNPVPIGDVPSTTNIPSSKFQSPKNGWKIAPNTNFTVSLAVRGIETGFFTNAAASFLSAPQQLNSQGQIRGHSHIVIERLDSLDQTTPPDPMKFTFFKGMNPAAVNGVLSAVVPGLPAGYFRMSSITTAANHQPVVVPIAQHGSVEDVIYFTVTSDPNDSGAIKIKLGPSLLSISAIAALVRYAL